MPPNLRENPKFQQLLFTPPAYRDEALSLMIADGNRTARELNLPEHLPMTRVSIVKFFVMPPRLLRYTRAIGTITTSNYLYAPYAGKGFVLVRPDLNAEEARLRSQYLWPTNKIDKSTAYRDAMEILRKADIAVDILGRDCRIGVMTCIPGGQTGHFVPIYWVNWSEKDLGPEFSGASVELFEPTKTILQLQVFGPRYILRKPLAVTNEDSLLSQTNPLVQAHASPVTK